MISPLISSDSSDDDSSFGRYDEYSHGAKHNHSTPSPKPGISLANIISSCTHQHRSMPRSRQWCQATEPAAAIQLQYPQNCRIQIGGAPIGVQVRACVSKAGLAVQVSTESSMSWLELGYITIFHTITLTRVICRRNPKFQVLWSGYGDSARCVPKAKNIGRII